MKNLFRIVVVCSPFQVSLHLWQWSGSFSKLQFKGGRREERALFPSSPPPPHLRIFTCKFVDHFIGVLWKFTYRPIRPRQIYFVFILNLVKPLVTLKNELVWGGGKRKKSRRAKMEFKNKNVIDLQFCPSCGKKRVTEKEAKQMKKTGEAQGVKVTGQSPNTSLQKFWHNESKHLNWTKNTNIFTTRFPGTVSSYATFCSFCVEV